MENYLLLFVTECVILLPFLKISWKSYLYFVEINQSRNIVEQLLNFFEDFIKNLLIYLQFWLSIYCYKCFQCNWLIEILFIHSEYYFWFVIYIFGRFSSKRCLHIKLIRVFVNIFIELNFCFSFFCFCLFSCCFINLILRSCIYQVINSFRYQLFVLLRALFILW